MGSIAPAIDDSPECPMPCDHAHRQRPASGQMPGRRTSDPRPCRSAPERVRDPRAEGRRARGEVEAQDLRVDVGLVQAQQVADVVGRLGERDAGEVDLESARGTDRCVEAGCCGARDRAQAGSAPSSSRPSGDRRVLGPASSDLPRDPPGASVSSRSGGAHTPALLRSPRRRPPIPSRRRASCISDPLRRWNSGPDAARSADATG
jgi:hypothetical protein